MELTSAQQLALNNAGINYDWRNPQPAIDWLTAHGMMGGTSTTQTTQTQPATAPTATADPLLGQIVAAEKSGQTSFYWEGRLWRKQSNGDWNNGVMGDPTYTAQQVSTAKGTTQPATQQAQTTDVASLQAQIKAVQDQIAQKQAQLTAIQQQPAQTQTQTSTDVASLQAQIKSVQDQIAQKQAQLAAIQQTTPTVNTAQNTASLKAMGLSDATIAAMTPDQQNMFAAIGIALQSQYDQNKVVPPTFTAQDLDRIMNEAKSDPNINQFYQEQLRVGQTEFMNAWNQMSGEAALQAAEQQRQFTEQKKNLLESEAAAGRAYSGFRKQAEQKLGAEQTGVIESSKQQIKRNVSSLGQDFEKTFGTGTMPQLPAIQGVTYNPIGNVVGTQERNQQADVTSRYNELVNREALTRGLNI